MSNYVRITYHYLAKQKLYARTKISELDRTFGFSNTTRAYNFYNYDFRKLVLKHQTLLVTRVNK
jgi:hypothetical protein